MCKGKCEGYRQNTLPVQGTLLCAYSAGTPGKLAHHSFLSILFVSPSHRTQLPPVRDYSALRFLPWEPRGLSARRHKKEIRLL